jgi:hypothetical protein
MAIFPTFLASALLSLSFAKTEAAANNQAFAIIVAADISGHQLSRESASLIFRRKQKYWEDGKRIQPVNLPATHPLRHAFSQCILGQEPEAMEDYWREMYFHGVLPPHVLASEEAVVLFVISTPGAIGYVSTCPTDRRVNVVLTIGDLPNCPKRTATCAPLQN